MVTDNQSFMFRFFVAGRLSAIILRQLLSLALNVSAGCISCIVVKRVHFCLFG